MIKRFLLTVMAGILTIYTVGCAAQPSQSANPNYQETKKMVVDMLKSDEGKKAIKEILTNEDMRKELVLDHQFVKETIIQTISSEKGKQFWKTLISDPKFAEKLAKTMMKENKKLLKKLMKDPEYQKMMMSILAAPKMQEQYLQLMKTQPFREQMQKVVLETISSPLFKAKLADAVKKAIEEQMKQGQSQGKKKEKSKKSKKGQQKQSS